MLNRFDNHEKKNALKYIENHISDKNMEMSSAIPII